MAVWRPFPTERTLAIVGFLAKKPTKGDKMLAVRVLGLVGHDAHHKGQYGLIQFKIDKDGTSDDLVLYMPFELLEDVAAEALKARRSTFNDRLLADENEPPLKALYFTTEQFLAVSTVPEGHELTFRIATGENVTLRIPKLELNAIIDGLHKLQRDDLRNFLK